MSGREAIRNRERLESKFIVKYFENQHPELFQKAVEFYKDVKQHNPGVHDLTKTVQFMEEVTPTVPIPRHYKNRKGKSTKKKQMCLQIPLINFEQTTVLHPASSPPQQQQTLSPPHPHPQQQTLSSSPPQQQQTLSSSPPQQQQTLSPPPPQQQQTLSSPPPQEQPLPDIPLSDKQYNDLLTELQKDQEISKILDDFPWNDSVDEVNNPHMDFDEDGINCSIWNDVVVSDITPLEIEVNTH